MVYIKGIDKRKKEEYYAYLYTYLTVPSCISQAREGDKLFIR